MDRPSLDQMDKKIEEFVKARALYDEAKQISNERWKLVEKLEGELMNLMELSEREEYIAPGIGKAVVKTTISYPTPKTLDKKREFFAWLRKTAGDEVTDAHMTVNANTLQTLIKNLTEEAGKRGEVLMPEGLDEPIAYKKISVK